MSAVGLPDTFFTAATHWRWLIVLYFFIGGLAGGCYFVAALIDLAGAPHERRLARLGYYVAFPAIVVAGLLLILDLTRPERFWHMLVQSETWRPMLKPWSPMSAGSWALVVFGALALLSFLAALAEAGRLRRWPGLARLRAPGLPGRIVTLLGGLTGFFVAGYTGVLLAVTNRPIWADSPLLGLVFLISAASTSIALLILLGWRPARAQTGIRALERMDAMVLVLELIAVVALIASLGTVARVWLSAWGALLLVGVVGLGILVPLALHWRPQWVGRGLGTPVAAALVLLGGFLLRMVVVLSSEGLGVV
jgi:formate-dependent nitrite reductase membrane component NrfD